MPAITVDDLTTLPRVPLPEARPAVLRPVRSVTTAPRGFEGEGFPVRRAFAGVSLADLDPFIHLDQMGEVEYAPGEPKGTSWHPHRGFETVTYMIDGIIGAPGLQRRRRRHHQRRHPVDDRRRRHPAHRDATRGAGGERRPVPRPPALGEPARPRQDDRAALPGHPRRHRRAAQLARRRRAAPPDRRRRRRHRGPGLTHTPITIVHATLQPGAELDLPWSPEFNALVYVLSGSGYVGAEHRPLRAGQLAVLGAGDAIRLGADRAQDSRSPALDLFIMGGLPIREPVAHYGPFVMNTHDELVQAFEDYRAGRLGTIPADQLR